MYEWNKRHLGYIFTVVLMPFLLGRMGTFGFLVFLLGVYAANKIAWLFKDDSVIEARLGINNVKPGSENKRRT